MSFGGLAILEKSCVMIASYASWESVCVVVYFGVLRSIQDNEYQRT